MSTASELGFVAAGLDVLRLRTVAGGGRRCPRNLPHFMKPEKNYKDK